MDTHTAPIDPATMLDRLSADDIARRVSELEGELKGLRIILRSLRARESAARRHSQAEAAR